MKRRDFVAGVAASILLAVSRSRAQATTQRPRLLISNTDAFTGLPLLRTRYATGFRPSADMEGWALSWHLTRQDSFAEKALAAMRAGHITKGVKPSRSWVDYARWSLAFDWLSGYPGFEPALQNRIADELMEGASAMLASPDFADPSNYSYHNYAVRYLALPAFVSAALDGFAGCNGRCSSWRAQVAKCTANVLETTNVVSPEGSYHESMDYMRITWASLTLLAELQRTRVDRHYGVHRDDRIDLPGGAVRAALLRGGTAFRGMVQGTQEPLAGAHAGRVVTSNPGVRAISVMPRPKLWGANDEFEMEGHAMSLIRTGYPVSICRSFLVALFPALFGLALFDPGMATAQDVKQIKLTEKHIQGFMAADEEMAKIYGANVDNSDPKVKAQAEAVAKKNGFASLAEHDDVSMNIAIIMSGIDQQTRTFTEPPERVREEIAALKADKSVSDEAKKEDLAQLEAVLKGAKPIQFKENIALVQKHFDKLLPFMQVLGPAD